MYIGHLGGSIASGLLADYIGRKLVLIASTAILLVFGCLTALSFNYLIFVVCRGVMGIGLGLMLATTNTYMAELFPLRRRGKAMVLRFV